MRKTVLTFLLILLTLPFLNDLFNDVVLESNGGVVVENQVKSEASGSNAKAESTVSTTVNGENVTVKSNQPGTVEVKNINGQVEIRTSQGVTPTIIKKTEPSFSNISNNRTLSIYSFLKGLFSRLFGRFRSKS